MEKAIFVFAALVYGAMAVVSLSTEPFTRANHSDFDIARSHIYSLTFLFAWFVVGGMLTYRYVMRRSEKMFEVGLVKLVIFSLLLWYLFLVLWLDRCVDWGSNWLGGAVGKALATLLVIPSEWLLLRWQGVAKPFRVTLATLTIPLAIAIAVNMLFL